MIVSVSVSSVQGTSSITVFFCTSLPQATSRDTKMSLALCLVWCHKLLNTSDFLRREPCVMVALPASLIESAWSFLFSPMCPRQQSLLQRVQDSSLFTRTCPRQQSLYSNVSKTAVSTPTCPRQQSLYSNMSKTAVSTPT